MTFQKGDWVTRKDSTGEFLHLKPGQIDRIIEYHSSVSIVLSKSNHGSHLAESLRLATKEELIKAKIIKVSAKKEEKMSEIKEYKVITMFPTATKDYQVGEIIKKGTALFKKAHKFPKFFEAVREEIQLKTFKVGDVIVIISEPSMWSSNLSNKNPKFDSLSYPFIGIVEKIDIKNDNSCIGGYGFANSYLKWRMPTKEEITLYNKPKVGDIVAQIIPGYFSFLPNVSEITKITDKDHIWVEGKNGSDSWDNLSDHNKYYRKATPEEVEIYKKEKETQNVVVSSNNIKLSIQRNGDITVEGKNCIINISEVETLLKNVKALNHLVIGDWTTSVADLEAVMNAYNKLK